MAWLIVLGCLSSFDCARSIPLRKKYFSLRRLYEQKYVNYDKGLSLVISMDQKVYSRRDTVLIRSDLINGANERCLIKIPKKYGDDYRQGDVRFYIKAPLNTYLSKWISDPLDLSPLPDSTYFISLCSQQKFSFSTTLNFYLDRVFISNDTLKVLSPDLGEYEIYATYENYDFIPELGDSADELIWMGRVRSNTIKFRINE